MLLPPVAPLSANPTSLFEHAVDIFTRDIFAALGHGLEFEQLIEGRIL